MFAGCRCPRCPEAILEGRTIEGCEVLACRRCGGAFVSAGVGLRLLAVLEPDVPPRDDDAPRAPCPVCRQTMKLVKATKAMTHVDTCARHGVWFDGGDLVPVMRAVATTLGKPVPKVASTLGQHASAARPSSTATQSTTPTSKPVAGRSRVPGRTPSGPLRDIATGANDVTGGAIAATGHVVGEVADIALGVAVLPFEVTFAVVGGLCDLLD